jgi:hypothetical protein
VTTSLPDRFHLWVRDDAAARAAFLGGERVDVGLTAYGEQDFAVEFLMGSGLWDVMSRVQPDGLRKENGKPWRALNGVEVLRELLRISNVAQVGRILRDVRLMHLAGFNAEAVRRSLSRGTPVIDPETLSNHLARISPRSMERSFYDHVRLLRKKGWLKPGTYAVDGHVIPVPYGKLSERAGVAGSTRGYMLVTIVGPVPEHARVIGWLLVPYGYSEKQVLRVLLRRMERAVGPLSRWMKVLLLDRGYWGAKYLRDLSRRHHISYVTLARDRELRAVEDVDEALLDPSTAWTEKTEESEQFGHVHVRLAGVEAIPVATDQRGGRFKPMNFVAADESDAQGHPLKEKDGTLRGRIHYATDLPTRKDPGSIRVLYKQRWTVENQGFRTLTQRFGLDLRAGRRFSAICARIGFVLMLHNAMSVLRGDYPGPWQQEMKSLGDRGVGPMLGGPGVAALTRGGAMGLWTTAQYEGLVELRQITKLQEAAKAALKEGRDAKQVLSDLLGLPPGEN